MLCLPPHCSTGNGLPNWAAVFDDPRINMRVPLRAAAAAWMDIHFAGGPRDPGVARTLPPGIPKAAHDRLMRWYPCLFNQVDKPATARAVVHFCEFIPWRADHFSQRVSGVPHSTPAHALLQSRPVGPRGLGRRCYGGALQRGVSLSWSTRDATRAQQVAGLANGWSHADERRSDAET